MQRREAQLNGADFALKMIKHIVMWKFKEGEQENMMLFRERLLALKGQIPEIRAMEVGVNVIPSERSYDAVLVAEFDSREALRSYSVNPLHKAVSEFCKSIRTSSVSVDYEF